MFAFLLQWAAASTSIVHSGSFASLESAFHNSLIVAGFNALEALFVRTENVFLSLMATAANIFTVTQASFAEMGNAYPNSTMETVAKIFGANKVSFAEMGNVCPNSTMATVAKIFSAVMALFAKMENAFLSSTAIAAKIFSAAMASFAKMGNAFLKFSIAAISGVSQDSSVRMVNALVGQFLVLQLIAEIFAAARD